MSKTPVKVIFALSFQKTIKRLRKKYPHIKDDVQPVIEQLAAGETPGDQIQSTGYTVYKVRIPNRDARRGKSGSYRMIYYIQTETNIILLTIYSKSEQTNANAGEIQAIVADLVEDDDE